MPASLTSRVAWLVPALLIVEACASGDRPTAPRPGPEFAISDGVHEGGTPGFYFLPPVVAQPTFSGSFDADITTLNPQIAICDITDGPDNDCGGAGGTSAVIVFTTTSTPAITVDPTTEQYGVSWDTRAAGFDADHTYRVHVTAGAGGARRELGLADVLLTTKPGQAKHLAPGDLIVVKDGRPLPIHFRIEGGIAGSVSVSAATASVPTGGTDLLTATVQDLHGAPLVGPSVDWTVTAAPGVAASLAPTSGPTTLLTAGTTPGTAVVTATSAGVSATVSITVECDCWTTKASMPTARYALGVGEIGGVLYAVGGIKSVGPTIAATVEAYDPASNTWTTKASMPTARHRLAVGVVNGILYAVGGSGNLGSPPAVLATVEAYDPATNSWTTKASMPTARFDLAVVVANGTLYAIGGISSAVQGVATVEAYDPATDTWTTKASMPTARFGLGVATINGKLYAVGGASNAPGGAQYATLEVYDPATDTWTTKASMSATRHLLASGAINGKLYAVGGESNIPTPTIVGSVEAYDPVSDLWTTKAAMPTARAFLGIEVVNGLLYAVGGAGPTSFTPLGTVEAYRP